MSGFFIEYNCNPKKLNIQDCVIRAMSLAFDKDWRLQYQELVSYTLIESPGWLCSYPQSFTNYLIDKGCEECTPFKAGRRKARVLDLHNHEKFSRGTYLVLIDRHLTCVKDNHLYDTWNCEDYIIRKIWEVKDV